MIFFSSSVGFRYLLDPFEIEDKNNPDPIDDSEGTLHLHLPVHRSRLHLHVGTYTVDSCVHKNDLDPCLRENSWDRWEPENCLVLLQSGDQIDQDEQENSSSVGRTAVDEADLREDFADVELVWDQKNLLHGSFKLFPLYYREDVEYLHFFLALTH